MPATNINVFAKVMVADVELASDSSDEDQDEDSEFECTEYQEEAWVAQVDSKLLSEANRNQ